MQARYLTPWLSQIQNTRWQKPLRAIAGVTLIGAVIGLGMVLGELVVSPQQQLVLAVVVTLAAVLITLAHPLYGLVAAIAISPLSYHFARIELGTGVPNLTVDRLAILLTFGLLALRTLTGRQRLAVSKLYLPALLFLFFYYTSFASYVWPSSRVVQFLLDFWILPLVIYLVFSNLVDSPAKLDLVLNVLLILAVYSAIYMIYENLTGNVLFEYQSGARLLSFYRNTDLRITRGLYGSTTIFGNLYVLLVPVSLHYLLKARNAGHKLLYLIAFGLLMIGVFYTYKRSVWIAMLLCLFLVQWFSPAFRRLFFVILAFAGVAMFTSWDRILASEAVQVRVTQTNDWQDANGRTEQWAAGLEYWTRSPLFGSGFRSYTKGPYLQTENLYIHLLASAGLAAFIPFVIMLLIVLVDSFRVFRQARDNPELFVSRELIAVFWGGFLAYWFMAYFGSGVEGHPIANQVLFAMAGSIVGSQRLQLLGLRTALLTRRNPDAAPSPVTS